MWNLNLKIMCVSVRGRGWKRHWENELHPQDWIKSHRERVCMERQGTSLVAQWVVKHLPANAGHTGLTSGLGRIPHALERLSCAPQLLSHALEPRSCNYRSLQTLVPTLRNTWSHHNEKPITSDPWSLQLEKSPCSHQDLAQTKKKSSENKRSIGKE